MTLWEVHSALTSAIIISIHCTGISEVYHLRKHDSWFLKSLDGIHVLLTFTQANIHYEVDCLAIRCSSRCESLKQYKSQSFKTDSNDKSQQYATQHLSNKIGQSVKKNEKLHVVRNSNKVVRGTHHSAGR